MMILPILSYAGPIKLTYTQTQKDRLRWSNTKNSIFLSLMLSDCSFTMLLCELP